MYVKIHPNSWTQYVARTELPPGEATVERPEDGSLPENAWLEMSDNELAQWASADLASGWVAGPAPEEIKPPHRVLKDTIVLRVKEAGKLTHLRQVIAALNDDQRFEWDSASWFTSTNPLIVQGVYAIGLDPAMILARDPLAP